jgi:hypothetical protein
LTLKYKQANEFFLNEKSYVTLELPPYFSFKKMLNLVSKELNGSSINEKELIRAKNTENIDYKIYSNKDGRYAWRKLELINPYLYVSLVNLITESGAWKEICDRFKSLKVNGAVTCVSIPIVSGKNGQKAAQILEWVEMIEKESLKYALDYEYLFKTDITDCYGSIYTHSIAWALHDKSLSKKKRLFDDLLGNKIDCHLEAMSYGQTNGIPQGSLLMNFIAELVLAYADRTLSQKLSEFKELKSDDYRILRYRDDYRIFTRKSYHGEIIMKVLSETLADLNMSLNTQKTNKSERIITDSVKADKILSFHDPKLENTDEHTLRHELLMIYELGVKYPNSGAIKKRLDKIDKINNLNLFKKNSVEIVSILANIVFDNPSVIYIAASIISKAIKSLKKQEKEQIFEKLLRKFSLVPNSGHLEIWLQRITLGNKMRHEYKEMLCKKVVDNKIELFPTNWITSTKIKKYLSDTEIVNQQIIDSLSDTIARKEVETFATNFY